MKRGMIQRVVSALLLLLAASLLTSCATGSEVPLRMNLGDLMIERLRVGMTRAEVDAVISEQKQYLFQDSVRPVESERDLFRWYADNYYPKDLLKTVQVGTTFRVLAYYTNRSGLNAGTMLMFFDDETQRLRGWVNSSSEKSREKFMHERLTSQLECAMDGMFKGMSHSQVFALIGAPAEVITPPQKSRALYEDHFWIMDPVLDYKNQKIEVYTYPLSNGKSRRVFLYYYPAADRLNGWGYDHAWDEAERYQREQQGTKKK